jgi:nucleoside-diphosphate-sugar epimerase
MAARDMSQGRPPGRVLVTGAAGFIGSHLVDGLLARGDTVIGLDRRSPADDAAAATNLAEAADHPRFSFQVADLCRAELDSLVVGCDVVFHLAAVAGVRASWGDRFPDYLQSNVMGTFRLLQACERTGVPRLVLASSSSVYGPVNGASRETDPTQPISPYAVSKLAAEQLCLAHAQRPHAATDVVVARYFTVYGPRQRPDMAIGRVLSACLTEVPFELYGDGSQRREFTYVTDAVNATIAAAACPNRCAVVNVGGGASASMIDVIGLAGELTGKPVPVTEVAVQPGDVPSTQADLAVAKRLLGYRPRVGLREGMSHQLDWLMDFDPAGRGMLLAGQMAVPA